MKQLSKEEALRERTALETKISELTKIIEAKELTIMDQIDSYEAACKFTEKRVRNLRDDFSHLDEEDQDVLFANHQLDVIHKALMKGAVLGLGDKTKRKWWGWFEWNETGSGVGFSFSHFVYWYSGSDVGARRQFDTQEKSNYFNSKFIDIHNRAMKR